MKKIEATNENGFPERFGEFLRKFNLNTNRLATKLGDSNPVKFRRWMSGEAKPNINSVRPIAEKYGVSEEWLLFGIGEMTSAGLKSDPVERSTSADTQTGSSAEELKDALIAELRQHNKELREEMRALREENKGLAKDLATIAINFPTASSQFTALIEDYKRAGGYPMGFRQKKDDSEPTDTVHAQPRYAMPEVLLHMVKTLNAAFN